MLSAVRSAWAVLGGVALFVAAGVAVASPTASVGHDNNLYVNGVPFVARVLTVRGAPADVAARLIARWRADPSVDWVHSQSLGQRVIVGRRRGPVSVSAALSAAQVQGYSRVVISATDARTSLLVPPALGAMHVPAGLRWLSVSESRPEGPPVAGQAQQRTERIVEYLGLIDAPAAVSQLRWIAALRRAGFAVQSRAANQVEAQRDREWLWLGLHPLGSRTAVVLQRRWSGASSP